MYITKFLKPNEVNDINTKGMFIKVMSCEGKLRIRATEGVDVLLDTEVRAGFDLQTVRPFSLIQITSEVEQKLEVWVSQHKLSYDALSTKASRANSFIAEHFGLSQQILPYDPSQSRVKIVNDTDDFYVGGEGVTDKNGIKVLAGAVYEHDSAAPLSAFVNKPITYVIDTNSESLESFTGSPLNNQQKGGHYIGDGKWLYTNKDDTSYGKVIVDAQNRIITRKTINEYNVEILKFQGELIGVRSSTDNELRIYKFDDSLNVTGELVVDVSSAPFDCRCVCNVKDEYIFMAGVTQSGYGATPVWIYDGESFVNKTINIEGTPSFSSIAYDPIADQIWAYEQDDITYVGTPALNDFVATTAKWRDNKIQPVFGDDHIIFYSGQLNGYASVYDRETGEDLSLSYSRAAYSDGLNIVCVKSDGVYISANRGQSYNKVYDIVAPLTVQGFCHTYELENEVAFLLKENGEAKAIFVSKERDTSTPKSTFRVFKESY